MFLFDLWVGELEVLVNTLAWNIAYCFLCADKSRWFVVVDNYSLLLSEGRFLLCVSWGFFWQNFSVQPVVNQVSVSP